MSRSISTRHLQGKERQEIIEAVQQQAKAAALQAIKPVLRGFFGSGSGPQTREGKRSHAQDQQPEA